MSSGKSREEKYLGLEHPEYQHSTGLIVVVMVKVKIAGYSMWPTLEPGQILECILISTDTVQIESLVNQIVVFNHPWKDSVISVKRVKSIVDGKLFVVGDNPDPNASQDSHNHGPIGLDLLIGTIRQ